MQINESQDKSWYRAVHRAYLIMKERGYEVIRSMKGDSKFQLVAFDETDIIFVVVKICKAKRLPSYEKALEELAKTRLPENGEIQLWVYEGNRGFHYFNV